MIEKKEKKTYKYNIVISTLDLKLEITIHQYIININTRYYSSYSTLLFQNIRFNYN